MIKRDWLGSSTVAAAVATLLATTSAWASPPLFEDRWVDITPQQVTTGSSETCIGQGLVVDPQNPSTLYWGNTPFNASLGGLFKTEDGGTNWRRIGKVQKLFPEASDHLDEPLHVRVNPNDPNHLYAGCGVRGTTLGFWISRDAGETFEMPQSFKDVIKEAPIQIPDIYDVAVDPSNFDHVLLSFHYPWGDQNTKWGGGAGILETRDGAKTWIVHPPVPGTSGAGQSIKFLYSPDLKQGNSETWLLGSQIGGLHRTADGGKTWTKVSDVNITHGGSDIYYSTKNDYVYTGGEKTQRSNDNGVTWEPVGLEVTTAVGGDGDRLWTGKAFNGNAPLQVSPEDDGATWTNFNDQVFPDGPYAIVYDQYYGILYASNWSSGVWALKANAGSGKIPPLTTPKPLPPVGGSSSGTAGSPAGGGSQGSGTGGTGTAGSGQGTGDGGGGEGQSAKKDDGGGGCAVGSPGVRRAGWPALALVLGLGAMLRRRRSGSAALQ